MRKKYILRDDDHTFDEFSNLNSVYLTVQLWRPYLCVTSAVIVGATKVLDINIFVYIRRDLHRANVLTHSYNGPCPFKNGKQIKN